MEDYSQKYLKYKAKYIHLKNKSKNSMSGGGNDKIQIMLFKADWCGHCKNFKNTWEAVSKHYKNKYNFITYDADTQLSELKKYNVDAFPTVLIQKGKELIPYNGDRSFEDFNGFIESLNN